MDFAMKKAESRRLIADRAFRRWRNASHLDLEPHTKHFAALHAPSHAHGIHDIKTPSTFEGALRRMPRRRLEAMPRVAYFSSEKAVGEFDVEGYSPTPGGEIRVSEGVRDDFADGEAGVFELVRRGDARELFERVAGFLGGRGFGGKLHVKPFAQRRILTTFVARTHFSGLPDTPTVYSSFGHPVVWVLAREGM